MLTAILPFRTGPQKNHHIEDRVLELEEAESAEVGLIVMTHRRQEESKGPLHEVQERGTSV